jgi:hypothetical protein
MPEGIFENIVWEAAIEHFTLEETAKLFVDNKRRLGRDGILSGYEYKSNEELAKILKQRFAHVRSASFRSIRLGQTTLIVDR